MVIRKGILKETAQAEEMAVAFRLTCTSLEGCLVTVVKG